MRAKPSDIRKLSGATKATKRKPTKRAPAKTKTPAKTPIDTSRARERKKPTTTPMQGMVHTTATHTLTDPAHEIVKAIHAVAVQIKELQTVLTHHHPEPTTLERLDDDSDSDIALNHTISDLNDRLDGANDKISELSDANARLTAKNTFLLTIIDNYKKKARYD